MKIYLACPYTHDLYDVRIHRFRLSCNAAAVLLNSGHIVFSPISMSHPIAMSNDLPLTFEFWQKQNHAFIDWCDEVHVLKLGGWDVSKGVADEIEYAEKLGKPVKYIETH